MRRICIRAVSFALIFCLLVACVGCDERPESAVYETQNALCYTNQAYGEHKRQYLDLVIPKNQDIPRGMILYIHGGGWIAGDKEAYADTLSRNADMGYVSAALNYRYATGKKVTCEDILDDIASALSLIKSICARNGVIIDKVMLTGGSAGGHLSLMYAYTRTDTSPITPVAVISYAGPTDLCDDNFYATIHVDNIKKMISKVSGADLSKKTVSESREQLVTASPVNYIVETTVPTVLCHGMKDDVVPYSNATTLYTLLCSAGVECEIITFPNSGHGLEGDPDMSEYADRRFYEFAEEYLQ